MPGWPDWPSFILTEPSSRLVHEIGIRPQTVLELTPIKYRIGERVVVHQTGRRWMKRSLTVPKAPCLCWPGSTRPTQLYQSRRGVQSSQYSAL